MASFSIIFHKTIMGNILETTLEGAAARMFGSRAEETGGTRGIKESAITIADNIVGLSEDVRRELVQSIKFDDFESAMAQLNAKHEEVLATSITRDGRKQGWIESLQLLLTKLADCEEKQSNHSGPSPMVKIGEQHWGDDEKDAAEKS